MNGVIDDVFVATEESVTYVNCDRSYEYICNEVNCYYNYLVYLEDEGIEVNMCLRRDGE